MTDATPTQPPPTPPAEPPLDEAGAGHGWIVLQFLLHAVAGVFSGRVLLLTAVGMIAGELAYSAFVGAVAGVEDRLVPSAGLTAEDFQPGSMLQHSWRKQASIWRVFVFPFRVTMPSMLGRRTN